MKTKSAVTNTLEVAGTATSEKFSEVDQAATPETLLAALEEATAKDFQVGQRVRGKTATAKEWGSGTVVEITGNNNITVQFADKERKIKAAYLELVSEVDELGLPISRSDWNLETKEMVAAKVAALEKELIDVLGQVSFFEARHLEYRIKAGRLLNKLKGLIEEEDGYGSWEDRCEKVYKIHPRTARNYMRDARAADNPPAPPEDSPEADAPDPYEVEVQGLIEAEKHKREAAAEANDTVDVRMTLHSRTPEERQLYKAEEKNNAARCQEILGRAFDEIIRPPAPVPRPRKKLDVLPDPCEDFPPLASQSAPAPVVEA